MYADDEWGRGGLPGLNIAAVEKRDRIAAMDEIKRALEVAEQAPFKFLVQHVGVSNEETSEHKKEAALMSLEHLRAFARPLGVELLVENIPNELSTPEGLLELLHAGRFTDIGVCFDVGHAHLAPGVKEAFDVLKDRIRSTHLHDNKKDRDSHLWPGEGTINWKEATELLRTAPHVPPLLLELEGETQRLSEKMAETFKKLESSQ
jgi:sugar phosphate isomerase/epimerase